MANKPKDTTMKTEEVKPESVTEAGMVSHSSPLPCSGSDTPETDRLEWDQECNYDVPWEDYCRRLERERNAARAWAESWRENWKRKRGMSMIVTTKLPWEESPNS